MTVKNDNSTKNKITLGLICSWGFGVLFLISSIAGIFDPAFGTGIAVSFLTASLFLLPPVREQVFNQTQKTLSGGVRFTIVIALMFLGAAMTPDFQQSRKLIYSPASSQSVQELLGHVKGNLTIDNVGFGKGKFGNKILAGVLSNKADKNYSYVQIEFNLYDADGAQVGSTLANINNLEPFGTWKFEAGILEDGVTMFKVKDITAF